MTPYIEDEEEQQELFNQQVTAFAKEFTDVLDELPDDAQIAAVLCAIGAAVTEVFLQMNPDKREPTYDWFCNHLGNLVRRMSEMPRNEGEIN